MPATKKARPLGGRRFSSDAAASELLRQEREELLAAQRELEASRQQYADLYELAPVGYITFDRAGCIRNINETGVRLLESTRTHLLGRPLLPSVKKPDRRAYLNHLTRLRRGDPQATVEVTLRTRTGREMAVQLISMMTESATQIRTAVVDITERKHVEEELRKARELLEKRVDERTAELRLANQKLQALFDGSPLAIFTLDRDGNIRSWNKSAEQMFGWTEKEVLGNPAPHVPEAQQEEFEAAREAGLQGKSITLETLRARKDGSTIAVRLSDAPLRNAQGQIVGTMGMLEDISERVRLEKALIDVTEEEKERLGRDLHDGLGQHLAGILFMAESLRHNLSANARVEAELAAKIVGHIRDAINVSRDLAKGLFPVELKTQGFVPGLEKMASAIAERFHMRCMVKGQANIRVPDENMARNLYRLAQEAAFNAAKHSHGKTIRIGVAQENGELCLTVEDDGVGIPEEYKKSRGMGLRIMEYRARMVGGKLEIRRRRQGGTVVTCSAATKS
jgi:PAS domain S-box-containing protein